MIKSLHSFVFAVITFLATQNGGLVKAQIALPSCVSVAVTDQFTCSTNCIEKGDTLLTFRGANGVNECSCSSAKLCDDDPSCAELLVVPGYAQQNCQSVCPSGIVAQAEDYVRYGSATTANPDQSHFVVSCRCNGVEQCNDSILISDRVNLPECVGVSITSAAACQARCESYGSLFLGYDYESKNDGEVSICSCPGANGASAPFCEDLDRRAAVNVSGTTSLKMTVVATVCLAVLSMMV